MLFDKPIRKKISTFIGTRGEKMKRVLFYLLTETKLLPGWKTTWILVFFSLVLCSMSVPIWAKNHHTINLNLIRQEKKCWQKKKSCDTQKIKNY